MSACSSRHLIKWAIGNPTPVNDAIQPCTDGTVCLHSAAKPPKANSTRSHGSKGPSLRDLRKCIDNTAGSVRHCHDTWAHVAQSCHRVQHDPAGAASNASIVRASKRGSHCQPLHCIPLFKPPWQASNQPNEALASSASALAWSNVLCSVAELLQLGAGR